MKTILIVEDTIEINEMISTMLTTNHYKTISAYSGSEALLYLEHHQVDLILLDLMLPGKSGQDVLKDFNNICQIPIIVLTAISDKQTITSLLRLGANDYIVKPFDLEELLARIEVQFRLRSNQTIKKQMLHYKDITMDLETFDVYVGEQLLILSKREFLILQLLMENPKKVFSKQNIYESVWQEVYYGDENTINVHISNIRKKLQEVNADEDYIETVWGIGVKLYPET